MSFEVFRQIFRIVHNNHEIFAELLSLLLKCKGKDSLK